MKQGAHLDLSRKRNRGILQAGLSAVIGRGMVLLVNVVSIPLTLRYLGSEQFGIWVTISATLALLFLLDFGVSSVMVNRLSEAYALDDRQLAGRYATTGLAVMIFVAAVLGGTGAVFWRFIPWEDLFHLSKGSNSSVVSHSAAVASIVFLIGLPAGLAASFLTGYQEVRTANIVAAIGACINLASIVLVVHLHGPLIVLVSASAGSLVGTNIACLVWLWMWHKPWLMPKWSRWQSDLVRPLLRSGGELFPLQLAGLIVFSSDNLVIGHYLGFQQVTPYSVTWRLVGYMAALQIVITPALWPAYAEAWTRGDILWIRSTLRNVMLGTMGFTALGCAALIIWGRTIIALWAGPAAVPTQVLLVFMCLWVIINMFMSNTTTLLAATNQIGRQAWLSLLAAVLNLAASVWLVTRIGSIGVLFATIGSYLIVLVVPQTLQTMKVMRLPVKMIGQAK